MTGASLTKALKLSGTGQEKLAICRRVLTAKPEATDAEVAAAVVEELSGVKPVPEDGETLREAVLSTMKGFKNTHGTLDKVKSLLTTGVIEVATKDTIEIEDEILATEPATTAKK